MENFKLKCILYCKDNSSGFYNENEKFVITNEEFKKTGGSFLKKSIFENSFFEIYFYYNKSYHLDREKDINLSINVYEDDFNRKPFTRQYIGTAIYSHILKNVDKSSGIKIPIYKGKSLEEYDYFLQIFLIE